MPRSPAQANFTEASIGSTVLPAAHIRYSGMNLLHTSDQVKYLCELYCLPTTQLQPIMQVQTHRAAPAMPASPGHCVSSTPLFPTPPSSSSLVSITQNSKANMRALGHPNTPLLAARSHWCCFLMCVSTQLPKCSSHPATKTLQQLPRVLPYILYSFLTSASAAQHHCLLLGSREAALLKAIPPVPCLCGPALDGGRPWCPLGLQSSRILFVKALALERCSELTAKRDLLCKEKSFLTNLFPSPRVNRQLGLPEQGLLIC